MKKLVLFLSLIMLLACAFCIMVSAEECVHTDNWEIKTGETGVFAEWEALNICPSCNLVLKDEWNEPLLESLGYAYFDGSFVQGFHVNFEAVEKYEAYTGQDFEYGIVAGVNSVVGNEPVNTDGKGTHEKAVTYNLRSNGTEHFDIKVVNIPDDKCDEKIIACAYTVAGGKVVYSDNGLVDTRVCGASLNEVINLLENGIAPAGLYEYRQLTVEEMDILLGHYWLSSGATYNTRLGSGNNFQRYAAPRMFSRSEVPSGSYVVIGEGWCARPEIWKIDNNSGAVLKNNPRPYDKAIAAGTYTIEELFKDTKGADGTVTQSEYKYISFNLSDTTNSDLRQMTADGVAEALQIYVPYTTTVAKNEVAKADNISVAGKTLMAWGEDGLTYGAYWNCTTGTTRGTGKPQFYATKQFTKETLPVGSVIEINSGWKARFEYWVNSAKVGTRGYVTDSYRIVVTEDFWDTESERAFNISMLVEKSLSKDDRDMVASAFRIYLPTK